LFRALDNSTPFRRPNAWNSIRGRSWAIHDGILGEPWHGIQMYKRVGRHAGVDTFPNSTY
jgi:acetoin utilization protein AcuC